MNSERRTPNLVAHVDYDLEERLLEYAARVIRLAENMNRSPAGQHISLQVIRSGTSPLANHGEAQAAESNADFIHKLKVCLKELRETHRWIRLVARVPLVKRPERIDPLLKETDELVRIFVTSIRTAQRSGGAKPKVATHRASVSPFKVQRSKFDVRRSKRSSAA